MPRNRTNRRRTAWLELAADNPTAETSVAAATIAQQILLTGPTNLFDEEMTIARIIGDFRIQNTAGAENVVYMGVRVQQTGLAAATSLNPRTESADEEWMWWRAFFMQSGGAVQPTNAYASIPGIDIRVKRKIHPGQDLVLLTIGTGTFDFGAAFRVLVHLA